MLEEFIKAIQNAVSGCVSAVNASLAKLPPVEQFQANQQLQYGLQDMQRSGAYMIDYFNRLSEAMNGKTPGALATAEAAANPVLATAMPQLVALAELVQNAPANIRATILAEVTTAGDYIAKSAHEAAIGVAETNARTAATEEFKASLKRAETLTAQRATLLAGIPENIAKLFPDDVLLGDDAATAAATFKDRFTKLTEVGVDPANEKQQPFLAEIAKLGGGGDGEYEVMTAPLFSLANKKATKPGGAINPAALAGGAGGAGAAKRVRV